jgi:thymidine kinase
VSTRAEVDDITFTVSSPYRAEMEIDRILTEQEQEHGIPRANISKYLGIDEGHFWGSSLWEFLLKRFFEEWQSFVTALDTNAKGVRFVCRDGFYNTGAFELLVTHREGNKARCINLLPDGSVCEHEATRTLLLANRERGEIAPYESGVLKIGTLNDYEPRCLACSLWKTPGELEHYTTWRAMRLISLSQQLQGQERHISLDSILGFDPSRFEYFEKELFPEIADGLGVKLHGMQPGGPSYSHTQRLWLLAEEAISAAYYFREFYLPSLIAVGTEHGTVEERVRVLANQEIQACTMIGSTIEVR